MIASREKKGNLYIKGLVHMNFSGEVDLGVSYPGYLQTA